MKFVIYGAGYRGRRLLRYLGKENVLAFIESSKNYNQCGEVPVIDLKEYMRFYNDIHIIVSPISYCKIEIILKKYDITSYSILSDLPSEFSGYGNQKFLYCYANIIKKYKRPCYIYGRNAFALMLYEALKKVGNSDVSFISNLDKETNFGNIFITYQTDIELIKREFKNSRIIDAFDYSGNLPIYYNSNITQFKNKYVYKKCCFIVATGSSLNEHDLNILAQKKIFCFSVNKIFKMKAQWKPDVYVATDALFLEEERNQIEKYDIPIKLLGDGGGALNNNLYNIHVVSSTGKSLPRFSKDIAQKVYGGATVTYVCIQIAIYFGFKEIYLLGVDCNYVQGKKNNHFYFDEEIDVQDHNLNAMFLDFQAAKEYSKKNHIKIFNATRGGNLEVFERVDFDELFGG